MDLLALIRAVCRGSPEGRGHSSTEGSTVPVEQVPAATSISGAFVFDRIPPSGEGVGVHRARATPATTHSR